MMPYDACEVGIVYMGGDMMYAYDGCMPDSMTMVMMVMVGHDAI
jgi:hypothetical protein